MESMQLYETIFIIHPELNEEDVEEHIKRVENLVTRLGGEILRTERWGKKRLAYDVDKHRYGYYVLLRLRGNSTFLPELERHYRLTEGIIKSLLIRLKTEPKEEPVMVAHEGSLTEEDEHSLQEDEEDEEGR
jgi:small subunit ribosomal protein S6